MARAHTLAAVQTIAGLMHNGKTEAVRLRAAEALLERGWGRPVQPIASDPDTPLIVEIIHRVRERPAVEPWSSRPSVAPENLHLGVT